MGKLVADTFQVATSRFAPNFSFLTKFVSATISAVTVFRPGAENVCCTLPPDATTVPPSSWMVHVIVFVTAGPEANRGVTTNDTGNPTSTTRSPAGGDADRIGAVGAIRGWPKKVSAHFCLQTRQNDGPSVRISQLVSGR